MDIASLPVIKSIEKVGVEVKVKVLDGACDTVTLQAGNRIMRLLVSPNDGEGYIVEHTMDSQVFWGFDCAPDVLGSDNALQIYLLGMCVLVKSSEMLQKSMAEFLY